jgi:hypothetical protein
LEVQGTFGRLDLRFSCFVWSVVLFVFIFNLCWYLGAPFGEASQRYFSVQVAPEAVLEAIKISKMGAPRALEPCREGAKRKTDDFQIISVAPTREHQFRASRGVRISRFLRPARPQSSFAKALCTNCIQSGCGGRPERVFYSLGAHSGLP